MSSILERIFSEVALLPREEQYDLYANLKARFEVKEDQEPSSTEVEAAWDSEIDYRLTDLKEGRVRTIPGEVADQQMTDFTSRLRGTNGAAL